MTDPIAESVVVVRYKTFQRCTSVLNGARRALCGAIAFLLELVQRFSDSVVVSPGLPIELQPNIRQTTTPSLVSV